jgi:hypothetical protein
MNRHGDTHLDLENCPQCGVATPLLTQKWYGPSLYLNLNERRDQFDGGWSVYLCSKCRRVILARAPDYEEIQEILPRQMDLPVEIPGRARRALSEALKITGMAPSLSILSCARAVEFMLDAKGIAVGTGKILYGKIEEAAAKQIIIPDMKTWAHEIRLAANGERHPDFDDATPTRLFNVWSLL